jgi:hypothetical protein
MSPPFLMREWELGAQLVSVFSWRTDVAVISVAGMELGAQLVAAFSEAHRYELNVAAVSKAVMGTGGSVCLCGFSGE